MEEIKDVSLSSLSESNFIKPYRMKYTQAGVKKIWDCIQAHDSVAVLIHNIDRDSFIFVKQFRPAVYAVKARGLGETGDSIDPSKVPGELGITHELCAGIVDKDLPTIEIAKMEVFEECGYEVPLKNFEKITKTLGGVGLSAATQVLYYAKVTDEMNVGPGGGNPEEGELIETVEIPVKVSLQFAMDESITKPLGMQLGILWFHYNKLRGEISQVH